MVPISSYDTAGSFLILGCNNGSIYYIGESRALPPVAARGTTPAPEWSQRRRPIKLCLNCWSDVQKFPLRMKDNDLLVTELYRDPTEDAITALSVYLTPKTSRPPPPTHLHPPSTSIQLSSPRVM